MLLFIEGYPYNLDTIVKDGLSIRDILEDVVAIPQKEKDYAFEYVGYCYSKSAKNVAFFLPKVVLTGDIMRRIRLTLFSGQHRRTSLILIQIL